MSIKDFRIYGLDIDQVIELKKFWLKHHDYLPNEHLTFDRIRRECVTGETLLIDQYDSVRLFLGFDRCGMHLITDQLDGIGSSAWYEKQIKDWKIGGKHDRSRD